MPDIIPIDEAYRAKPIEGGFIPVDNVFQGENSIFALAALQGGLQGLQQQLPLLDKLNQPERPGLLARAGASLANSASAIARQLAASAAEQNLSESQANPFMPEQARADLQQILPEQAQTLRQGIGMPAAQNTKEMLADVGGAVVGSTIPIAPMSGVLRAGGLWGPLADAIAFGTQTKAEGGSFAGGAAMGGVLGVLSKIPASTLLDQILVKGAESGAMGGLTTIQAQIEGRDVDKTELAVNMALPISLGLAGKAVDRIRTRTEAKLREAKNGADVVSAIDGARADAAKLLTKEDLLTVEGAKLWAEHNSDAAAKLAKIENPSGNDFMEAGVTNTRRPAGQAERWTKDERTVFSRTLREALAPKEETANVQGNEGRSPNAPDGSGPVPEVSGTSEAQGGAQTSQAPEAIGTEETQLRNAQAEIPQSEVAAGEHELAAEELRTFVESQRKLGKSMKSIEQSTQYRDLNKAVVSAKGKETAAIEMETRQAAIDAPLDRDNVKYKPLSSLPLEVADAIKGEARNIMRETNSKDTEKALQKIIDGKGDTGPMVEDLKERIVGRLLGELELPNHLRNPEPHPALEKALYGDDTFDVSSIEGSQGKTGASSSVETPATITPTKEPTNGKEGQRQGRPEGLLTDKTTPPPGADTGGEGRSPVERIQGLRVKPEPIMSEEVNGSRHELFESNDGNRAAIRVTGPDGVTESTGPIESVSKHFTETVERAKRAGAAPAEAPAAPEPTLDQRQGKTGKKSLVEKLSAAEEAAKKRLAARASGGTLFANPLDPALLADLAVIGASKIVRGAVSIGKFTREMVAEYGPSVRPHVLEIWEASKKHLQSVARPDLANPITDPKARVLTDVVDYHRNQGGRPKRRTMAELQAGADKLDYRKTKRQILKMAEKGDQLNPEQTIKAKEIINREGMKAIRSGKIIDQMKLVEAYRDMRSEQATAMAMGRDPVETPAQRGHRMVMESLITPDKKTQQAIEKAKAAGDEAGAEQHRRDYQKKFEDLKRKLKVLGIDVDNIDKMLDPVKQAKALKVVSAAKADFWDKLYEYWRNSILSAPVTQVANIASNMIHGGTHFALYRPLEAMVNTVFRTKEGAQLGELPHIAAGILPGLSHAAQNFLKTWSSETPWFEQELGTQKKSKIEGVNTAIEGKMGEIVRSPQRTLSAADDFAKTLFAEMDVGAQAYRIAKGEGLRGPELSRRMAELHLNTDSLAWMRAIQTAHDLTFTNEPGAIAKSAINMRKAIPYNIGYFLMPFISTPANIFGKGIRYSPLGGVKLLESVYTAARTGNWEGVTARAAEQMVAWGVVLALYNNDEKDPWITGAAPPGRGIAPSPGAHEMSQRAIPQQSIKIGDRWFSYSRVEPFATAISAIVDGMNAFKSGDGERMAKAPLKNLLGQVGDKTFLVGLGDVLQAIQSQDPADLAKWASKFTVSWVPNAVRSVGRSMGETKPERSVWGQGTEYTTRMLRRMLQSTELGIIPDQPDYDLWGRPTTNTTSPIPNSDVLYRMFVPSYSKKYDVFVADRALLNWNNQHPEDEKFPESPQKYYKDPITKQTEYMTDEQYATYSKRSGEIARQLLSGVQINADKPTMRDIKMIGRAIEKGRTVARREIIIQAHKTQK